MKMVFYPDDLLRIKTKEVKDINSNVKKIVSVMIKIMDSKNGVGLAAPQVGLDLSLFVIRKNKILKPLVFINPKITSFSHEFNVYKEGCLSIPGIFYDLKRPKGIFVEAYDLKGSFFKIESSDFLARIVQHELDHLKGILFIDYYDEKLKTKILENYFKPM